MTSAFSVLQSDSRTDPFAASVYRSRIPPFCRMRPHSPSPPSRTRDAKLVRSNKQKSNRSRRGASVPPVAAVQRRALRHSPYEFCVGRLVRLRPTAPAPLIAARVQLEPNSHPLGSKLEPQSGAITTSLRQALLGNSYPPPYRWRSSAVGATNRRGVRLSVNADATKTARTSMGQPVRSGRTKHHAHRGELEAVLPCRH